MYNPEDVGLMLWKWMRPNDDFQHLPSWRELVVVPVGGLWLSVLPAFSLVLAPSPFPFDASAWRGFGLSGSLVTAGRSLAARPAK